jgi:hypothetical protein
MDIVNEKRSSVSVSQTLPREESSIFQSLERCKGLQEEVEKSLEALRCRLNPIIHHGPSVVKDEDKIYSVNGLSPVGESLVGLEMFLNSLKDKINELEKSLDI